MPGQPTSNMWSDYVRYVQVLEMPGASVTPCESFPALFKFLLGSLRTGEMNRCVHLRPVALAPLTPAGPALTSATIGPHCRIRGEAFAYHSVPLHCVACFRALAFYVAWCCVSERCRQAPPCHGATAADSREEGPGLVPRLSHARNSATSAAPRMESVWSSSRFYRRVS